MIAEELERLRLYNISIVSLLIPLYTFPIDIMIGALNLYSLAKRWVPTVEIQKMDSQVDPCIPELKIQLIHSLISQYLYIKNLSATKLQAHSQ